MSRSDETTRAARPLELLAALGFLAIGFVLFPGAGSDDSYITFWPAHALADFGEIVNYNGDRVEQSSSLGLVVILGLLRWCTGVEVSILGKLVSIACGAATVVATARLARAVAPSLAGGAAAILATTAYFVYWSFSGMETSLAALSGVLLLLVLARLLEGGATWARWTLALPVTLLYLLARPENWAILLATFAGVGGLLALRRIRATDTASSSAGRVLRRASGIVLIAAASWGAIALFRLTYFGALQPQPVAVKYRGLGLQTFLRGSAYVFEQVQTDYVIVTLLAVTAVVRVFRPGAWARPSNPARDLCVMFYLASLSFIVFSGGDWMVGGRFLAPSTPMAAILGLELLGDLISRRSLRLALMLVVVAQLGGVMLLARTKSNSEPLWAVSSREPGFEDPRFHWFERANRDHRRYFPVIPELELWIDRARDSGTPVRILSGQSGFAMYHVMKDRFRDLRYYDRFGLCTRDFPSCRLSAGVPRTEWGLLLRESFVLRRLEAFQVECGIPPPDLVFDLFVDRLPRDLVKALQSAGYRAVYLQDPVPRSSSTVLPGNVVGARIYIAVPLADRER